MNTKNTPTKTILEEIWLNLNKPSGLKKISFFRLLAVTQNAGLWLKDALMSLRDSERDPKLRMIIVWLLDEINKWYSLSEAMRKYDYFFTPAEIALVESAEKMGNLPQVLSEIADDLETFAKIKWKIKWAMTYPVVVIIFSMLAVYVLLNKVVPIVVDLFPSKDKLPGITKFVLALSDFVQTKWFFVLKLNRK